MPASRLKTPPPNVARLTTEEQIGYLFHQHEISADWRLLVDERLEKGEAQAEALSRQVDGLGRDLSQLAHKMEERHSQIILIQQQVLIAVQGQRIPGLEAPGITDRTKALEDRCSKAEEREKEKDAKISKLEEFQFRVLATLAVFTALAGLASWALAPYITQILALLK
jgi:chromosome segregation ATPase